MLLTKEDFQKLKLGCIFYHIRDAEIKQYLYAGISPVSDMIMCISSSNCEKMSTIYIPGMAKQAKYSCYTENYEEAKDILLDQAEEKVKAIKDIYFSDKKGDLSFWRNRSLEKLDK
jgi:hypothetical protein